MEKKMTFDLPTRIFHWSFAGFFILAFAIANGVDDENPLFSYHMLAGFMMVGLVVFRLIWGVIGSRYARFSAFALRPTEIISYFTGIFSGQQKRFRGHNPATRVAAILMFGFAILLGVTGYLMSTGYRESLEDVHELLANAFLGVVVFHIAGVIFHSLRHQDGIAFSMVHGKKTVDENDDQTEIPSQRVISAVVLLAALAGLGSYLVKNYDAQTQQLNLFGKVLLLGEGGEEGDEVESRGGGEDHDAEEGEEGEDED